MKCNFVVRGSNFAIGGFNTLKKWKYLMNKLAIPAILTATVLMAGMFAFSPVEQASTVHTSGAQANIVALSANMLGGAAAATDAVAT